MGTHGQANTYIIMSQTWTSQNGKLFSLAQQRGEGKREEGRDVRLIILRTFNTAHDLCIY